MGERTVKPGFSLIECCIVVALCLVVCAVTMVHTGYLYAWLVRSDIALLHTVCRYAQQQAILTGQAQKISISTSDNSYSVNEQRYVLSPGVMFGVIPGAQGPPSHPRTPLVHPVTFKDDSILCSPDGVISAGTVYLCDKRRTVLYALSNAVADISYLRMYVYKKSWMPLT